MTKADIIRMARDAGNELTQKGRDVLAYYGSGK